jgi:hypothetical protein
MRIYVYLLNEGTHAWRPVEADHLGGDRYRIASVNDDPEDEEWQFNSGDIVQCAVRHFSDGPELVATRLVAEPH